MVQITNVISALDYHTAGHPVRIVQGGVPPIRGKTMQEKHAYARDHLEWLRSTLMDEPRGHKAQFGIILTEPCRSDCDFGTIMMSYHNYLEMCGHGMIGLATMLTDLGMVPWQGDTASIAVDTPAGKVVTKVIRTSRGDSRVRLANVPSFHYMDVELEVGGHGRIPVQIAFGGLFFALIDAVVLGVPLIRENLRRLMDIGQEVKAKLNEQIEFRHPVASTAVAETLRQFEFYETISSSPPAWKNLVLYGPGDTFTVDRSPCGTGTSAKMAAMFAKGDLKVNQDVRAESFVGTAFTGRIIEVTRVGELQAVVPEIEGSAYLTGRLDFFIDPKDPLKHGFKVGL